ncbi:MAG: hypothetical protein RI964_2084 [Pseudomonadota bacterium]|jgi:hypothetical protein
MQHQQPPLHLQAEASRLLAIFLCVIHALAGLVVLFMPHWVWWAKLAVWGLIANSGFYYWRLHIRRSQARSVQAAVFYAVDNWRIHTPRGSYFATLLDSSFVHPWLCVLNLQADGTATTRQWWQRQRIYTLILLPDSLPQEVLRQLRVRLKFA